MSDSPQQDENLAAEIDAAAQQARKRMKIAWLVAVVVLLILGGYLAFAHRQIDKTSRAEVITSYTQSYLMGRLPEAGERFERHLEERAPAYVERAGKAALDAPRALRVATQNFLLAETRQRLGELESQLAETLKAQVEALAAEIDADTARERRAALKGMLSELARMMRMRTVEAIEKRYRASYAPKARVARAYLRKLVERDDLTDRQKRQRSLLVSVLTLKRKLDEEDAGRPVSLPLPEDLRPLTSSGGS